MPLKVNSVKVSYPQGFDKELTADKNLKALKSCFVETSDASSMVGSLKIVRRAMQLSEKITPPTVGVTKTISAIATIGDVFKTLDAIRYINTIVEQSQKEISKDPKKAKEQLKERNLRIASAVTGTAISSLTSLKLLDSLGAFKLANVTAALGKVPVFGAGAALFPFSSVTSVFEIVKAAIDIAISVEKLKQIKKKETHVCNKETLWTKKITVEKANSKIESIPKKMQKIFEEVQEQQKITDEATEKAAKLRRDFIEVRDERLKLLDQVKSVKGKERRAIKIKLKGLSALEKKQRKPLFKAIQEQNDRFDELKNKVTKYNQEEKKLEGWNSIRDRLNGGELSKDETDQLDKFCSEKRVKWDIKHVNLKTQKLKENLSIFFNTLILVVAVTTIILAAIGAVALPITIALACLSLTLAIAGTATWLHKKYHREKPYESVPVPILGKPAGA